MLPYCLFNPVLAFCAESDHCTARVPHKGLKNAVSARTNEAEEVCLLLTFEAQVYVRQEPALLACSTLLEALAAYHTHPLT